VKSNKTQNIVPLGRANLVVQGLQRKPVGAWVGRSYERGLYGGEHCFVRITDSLLVATFKAG